MALGAALLGGCAAEHVIGSAGLGSSQTFPSGVADLAVQALAAADFDGDGRVDVALFDGAGRLCVMAGDASGGLGAARCQTLAAGAVVGAAALRWSAGGPWGLVAGGDVVQTLSVRSDGTFAVTATASSGVSAVLAVEPSGDGTSKVLGKVLGAERQSPTVAVWQLSADGQLGAPVRYQFEQPQSSLLAMDLDGDMRPELAALGGGQLSVYAPAGAAAVAQCPVGVFGLPQGLAAVDVDDDGRIDLVAADSTGSGLVVFRNSSTGDVGTQLHFDCGTAPLLTTVSGLALLLSGDLDGDGAPDAVAVGSEVVLVRGRGQDVARYRLPTQARAQAATLVDFDQDGRLDVLLAIGSSVAILRNSFQQ